MAALTERSERPHLLALNKIAALPDATDIQHGDSVGFECFALRIQALVGLPNTSGQEGNVEYQCASSHLRYSPYRAYSNLKWETFVLFIVWDRVKRTRNVIVQYNAGFQPVTLEVHGERFSAIL